MRIGAPGGATLRSRPAAHHPSSFTAICLPSTERLRPAEPALRHSTAMAALCLEVYARYLPLYQIGERDKTATRR